MININDTELPYLQRINPLTLIFGSLFIVIIPFLIWASWAELEQRSSTHGNVIATGKTQKIQSAIEGVIESIEITEGQTVKYGDILFKLEQKQTKAALEAISSKNASLKAQLYRLRQEVLGNALIYPDNFIDKKHQQYLITQKKLHYLREKALNDSLISLQKALKIKVEKLVMNKKLYKRGDIGKMTLLDLEAEVTEIEGKIENTKNTFFQKTQEEKTKVEEEYRINLEMKKEKEVNLQRSTTRAQLKAIVKDILITTKGARVQSGDVILELVPLEDELIIETKLSPVDISYVKVGQKAHVKFDTYDFSIYGMFDGEVKFISPDTIIEKTPKGDEHYYKVQVVLDKGTLIAKNGQKISVAPGMGAQVDIITGNRTVLHYLTKPIIKTIDESFIER